MAQLTKFISWPLVSWLTQFRAQASSLDEQLVTQVIALTHEEAAMQATTEPQQQLPSHLPQLSLLAAPEQLDGIPPQGVLLSPPQPHMLTSAVQAPRHKNPRTILA